MNNKGFATLVIIFIIAILSGVAILFAIDNNGLNRAIKYERREQNNANIKYEQLKDFTDNKFYYRDNDVKDIYILEKCRMKYLDYNEFIELRNDNYK